MENPDYDPIGKPLINYLSILGIFLVIMGLNSLIGSQRMEYHLSEIGTSYYDTPIQVLGNSFKEIKRAMADVLWIRVDTYFHSSLTKEEHEMIHPGHPEHLADDHEDQPKQGRDTQFLPLIRLVVDLDPNFIEAYRVGSWWLWQRLNQIQTAIDFLKEGMEKNPENAQLHYDLAWIYFIKLENYTAAKEELLKSVQIMENQEKELDLHDYAPTLELLAFTCERLNQNSESIIYFKKIAELDIAPYSAVAKRKLMDKIENHDSSADSMHQKQKS